MLSPNFSLMLRVHGDISPEAVQNALDAIRVRHLALIPSAASNGELPDIYFPLEVREDCEPDAWIKLVAKELLIPFEASGVTQARVFLLKHADRAIDIVATFNHGLSDGLSGVFFLRDLLQALDRPTVRPEPLPIPPPFRDRVPDAIANKTSIKRRLFLTILIFRVLLSMTKIKQRLFGSRSQTAETTNSLSLNHQCLIIPVALAEDRTTALVNRCKKEEVTVHAAICAAWLRAFYLEFKTGSARRLVSSPVNLRDRLAVKIGETSGTFLALVTTDTDASPDVTFWQTAREFKNNFLPSLIEENYFFDMLLYDKVLSDFTPEEMDIVAEMLFNGKPKYDFSITNLGRLPFAERYCSLSLDTFYGPLVNSSEHERTVGVSTLGGRLTMTFLLRRSNMSDEQAKALQSRALALLGEAVGW